MDALNVVYEEKEKRGFIKLTLVSFAFTIAAIASLLIALGAVVVVPVALSYLGFQNVTELIFRLARWPILLLGVIFGLAVLYRVLARAAASRAGSGSASAARSQRLPGS